MGRRAVRGKDTHSQSVVDVRSGRGEGDKTGVFLVLGPTTARLLLQHQNEGSETVVSVLAVVVVVVVVGKRETVRVFGWRVTAGQEKLRRSIHSQEEVSSRSLLTHSSDRHNSCSILSSSKPESDDDLIPGPGHESGYTRDEGRGKRGFKFQAK